MPIISAAVVTHQGRILLARQFMDTGRMRIEGLLAAFPKLVTSGGTNQQSTYIDNGNVRYVYQPLESFFLVLVTTRNSNIVEDLATLRLLGRLVNEQAGLSVDEKIIQDKTFEIMFAMDEVVTSGTREAVTFETVLTTLAMQSLEEEQAKADEATAIEAAKKEARRRAYEIKQKKMDAISGGGYDSSSSLGGSSGGGAATSSSVPSRADPVIIDTTTSSSVKSTAGGGMSLSKAGRKTDQASRMLAEAGANTQQTAAPPSAPLATAATGSVGGEGASVAIKVEEKISATLNRDGGVSAVDIKGDLIIHVADPVASTMRIRLAALNTNPDAEFTFKTHPNINKALFQSDSVLVGSKPYPLQQSLGILRWRCEKLGPKKLPISVNCWPSDDSASVEFELENPNVVLRNVTITIPITGATVGDIQCGTARQDSRALLWEIPLIDRRSSSGTMEVLLSRQSSNNLFPVSVRFDMDASLAGVSIVEALAADSGKTVSPHIEYTVTTDGYQVV